MSEDGEAESNERFEKYKQKVRGIKLKFAKAKLEEGRGVNRHFEPAQSQSKDINFHGEIPRRRKQDYGGK